MGSSLPVEQGPGEFWDLPAKHGFLRKLSFRAAAKLCNTAAGSHPPGASCRHGLWAPSASSALSSSSLRVADKLPVANLLLLKRLMALLQHIGNNAATSRMSCSNLAICVGPNLLSPPNEDLLPLQAMLAVTEKVRPTQQPAAAFPAHRSLAVERSLAASSLEPGLVGWVPGRATPSRSHLRRQSVSSGKGCLTRLQAPGLRPRLSCLQVNVLVEFLIENCGDIFGGEVAGLSPPSAEEVPAPMHRRTGRRRG